jgi:hypothetical protein
MLTPPIITEGRTIRSMPAKRRDSCVMTTSIRSRKLATGPEDLAEQDADYAKSRLHAGSTHLMR